MIGKIILVCDIPNSFSQLLLGKTYLTSQIFLIYEGDPLSPPEGEAPQGVRPLDPRVKLKCSNNILAQRCPNEAAERPRRGGLAHIIEYFCEMNSGSLKNYPGFPLSF